MTTLPKQNANLLLKIEGITLLSTEEAKALPETIRACGDWWWLRSPGFYSDVAASVIIGDSVYGYGSDVGSGSGAVRPALIIPELEDLDLEKYKDSVTIFDGEWIYIGDGMVLAEKPIFYSRFDPISNNYETSEIKQKLEDWLQEQMF